MPYCPYCQEWLMSEDELTAHVASEHSEQNESWGEVMRSAIYQQAVPQVAISMVDISLKYDKPLEEIASMFGARFPLA